MSTSKFTSHNLTFIFDAAEVPLRYMIFSQEKRANFLNPRYIWLFFDLKQAKNPFESRNH